MLDLRSAVFLDRSEDASEYARTLDVRLRGAPTLNRPRVIYVEMPPDTPEWTAVRDRLLCATKPLP